MTGVSRRNSEGYSDKGATEEESLGVFIARCLRANGVTTVFGIPGTHNIEIYRGLSKFGIDHVLTRHEQGATYAADGYARASGAPGVVVATSGPGATNCITGIANAYGDSVPILVITPGAARGEERRDLGFLHEVKDQRAGIDHFAQSSIRVESTAAVEQAINGAFLAWRTGRPRPVHIEVPTDIIGQMSKTREVTPWRGDPSVAPTGVLESVALALRGAERPLLVVGGGCVDAGREVTRFAELTGIPVVTTLMGKGVLSEENPLSLGAAAGTSSPFRPVERADLVVALGTELKGVTPAPTATVVRFDIEAAQLNKHHPASIAVLGDVAANLDLLCSILARSKVPTPPGQWVGTVRAEAQQLLSEAVSEWGTLHRAIRHGAGGDPIYTGDSSQISYRGTASAGICSSPRSLLTTDGFATLGYSLPAAIGAMEARTGRPVVCLLGDGAFMFSVQELATAAARGLPLPIVLYDNEGYAEIRQNMADAGIEPYAVDLPRPNYEALALAFGCGYALVNSPQQLEREVDQALGEKRPTLIIVRERVHSGADWR